MPADGRRQCELAVGERAGTSPTSENGARLAIATLALCTPGRAVATINVGSLVQDSNAQVHMLAQLKGRKHPSRTSAHDDHVKAFALPFCRHHIY
jgi:hypothetical protein